MSTARVRRRGQRSLDVVTVAPVHICASTVVSSWGEAAILADIGRRLALLYLRVRPSQHPHMLLGHRLSVRGLHRVHLRHLQPPHSPLQQLHSCRHPLSPHLPKRPTVMLRLCRRHRSSRGLAVLPLFSQLCLLDPLPTSPLSKAGRPRTICSMCLHVQPNSERRQNSSTL